MQKLAEIYGLSDRGLAKTCERHLVPVPPRGYWAKVEAGQPAKRRPLRAVENTALQTVHIGHRVVNPRSEYVAQVLAAASVEMERENEALATAAEASAALEPEPPPPPKPKQAEPVSHHVPTGNVRVHK